MPSLNLAGCCPLYRNNQRALNGQIAFFHLKGYVISRLHSRPRHANNNICEIFYTLTIIIIDKGLRFGQVYVCSVFHRTHVNMKGTSINRMCQYGNPIHSGGTLDIHIVESVFPIYSGFFEIIEKSIIEFSKCIYASRTYLTVVQVCIEHAMSIPLHSNKCTSDGCGVELR